MASTRSSYHTSTLATAIAFVCTAFASTCTMVVCWVTTARDIVGDFMRDCLKRFEAPRVSGPLPLERVQACAHAARQAKRERFVSFGTWRMCPST